MDPATRISLATLSSQGRMVSSDSQLEFSGDASPRVRLWSARLAPRRPNATGTAIGGPLVAAIGR